MHECTLRTTLDEMLIALNFNEMGCVTTCNNLCWVLIFHVQYSKVWGVKYIQYVCTTRQQLIHSAVCGIHCVHWCALCTVQ